MLFSIWQNIEPTVATFYVIRQIYIVIKGQEIFKNKVEIWSNWSLIYHQCDQKKIAKCQWKLLKYDSTRNMKDFDNFTKIA